MAERVENGNIRLNTYEKSLIKLREMQRVRDLLLAKYGEDLTPRQRTYVEKMNKFLGDIGDVGVLNNGAAKIASTVTPDSWRMPRWGSINATRPNPLLQTFYPSEYGQGRIVEPDSGQINNAFNASTRLPTVREVNNGEFANGDAVRTNGYRDHSLDEVGSAVLSKELIGPIAYGAFTTPALATDAIGTVYATIRNGYNAIADFYNKHKAKTGADKGIEKYLEDAKKQIDEADKYQKKLAGAYNNYLAVYGGKSDADTPSFDDIVKQQADADTLYYIKTKLDKRPDEIPEAKLEQIENYQKSKTVPTKAATKTRDQILLGLGQNPYAAQRAKAQPAQYLGK